MKFKNGKTVINKSDLSKRLIVIKNYENQKELEGVQKAISEKIGNVLAIPEKSFDKYNKFRIKNKMKPILRAASVDVQQMKIEEMNKELEETKEFMERNKGGEE